jgi:alpha-D-ribose 1-methylphosphonate 5-phosphate C-P lyase
MTTKMALRLYGAFRRNAVVALSPWEKVPATALDSDTVPGIRPPADGGVVLPEEPKQRR